MQKSLPPFLQAKFGEYRAHGETHVRVTAESCVFSNDLQMLRSAQPIEGFVEHTPSGERKPAVFTRLKIDGVRAVMLAHRVTGTLYRAHDGVSSSPALKAVVR